MKRRRVNLGRWTAFVTVVLTAGAAAAQKKPAGMAHQNLPKTQPTTKPVSLPIPVTFGRSGKKVIVDLLPMGWSISKEGRPGGQPVTHWVEHVILRAYGRTWTDKIPVKSKRRGPTDGGILAEIEVPSVRVPTVFSIQAVTPTESDTEIGVLVAYPDRDVKWDKNITLYTCGAPAWFTQWAAATGLPVTTIDPDTLTTVSLVPPGKGQSLLILGRATAGKAFADVVKLADDKKVNVLILDADWFGKIVGPVKIAPKQMTGGLSEVAGQRWAEPLGFPSRRKPWPGIANRCAWIIDDTGLPLVERVWMSSAAEKPMPIALSYIPWKEQLGRNESADAMLLAVLRAFAKMQPSVPYDDYHGYVVTVWPAKLRPSDVTLRGSQLTAPSNEERPVLSSISIYQGPVRQTDMGPLHVKILDLRGATSPSNQELNMIEKSRGRLIILGDDKMLDEWKWLKLDREKKTVKRGGVVWLSDDELPPSKDSQIRLMLKLTELGVPLALPDSQEHRNKEMGK